jgi:hypothetical protein
MPLTTAERQARFRKKHLGEEGNTVLHVIVEPTTMRQLKRLARRDDTTLAAIVKSLAAQAHGDALDRMTMSEKRRFLSNLES